MAPLVSGDWTLKATQQFSKRKQSRIQIYLKKSLKPGSSSLVKIIILDMYGLDTKYIGIRHSLKSI